jgi:nucleoside-triphosphatase THEP1
MSKTLGYMAIDQYGHMKIPSIKISHVVEDALTDSRVADAIGKMLAENLYLTQSSDRKDRWITDWGTKTNQGLARIVANQILRALEEKGKL